MENTVYDAAFTEIVNIIHECSRITEGIEGKVIMLVNDTPAPPMDTEGIKEEPSISRCSATLLGTQLSEVREVAERLHERLASLESSILM